MVKSAYSWRSRASSKAHIQRLQERIAALENGQAVSPPRESDEDRLPVPAPTKINPIACNSSETLDGSDFRFFLQEQSGNSLSHLLHVSNGGKQTEGLSGTGDLDFRKYADFSMDDHSVIPTTSEDHLMPGDFTMVNALEPSSALPLHSQEPTAEMSAWLVEARSEMIDRLCSTMGQLSVDETGQLRYFGSTSNLHVTSSLPPTPPPIVTIDQDLESVADSKQIQSHLLNLYFNYHNPQFQFVQRDVFLLDYTRGLKTQYYSPFLLHCLLLRSVRLSNNLTVRKLDQLYLARAKQELAAELENPTVSSMSALCLLGDYIGGLGNDRAGWLYPGRCTGILFVWADADKYRHCVPSAVRFRIKSRLWRPCRHGFYLGG